MDTTTRKQMSDDTKLFIIEQIEKAQIAAMNHHNEDLDSSSDRSFNRLLCEALVESTAALIGGDLESAKQYLHNALELNECLSASARCPRSATILQVATLIAVHGPALRRAWGQGMAS